MPRAYIEDDDLWWVTKNCDDGCTGVKGELTSSAFGPTVRTAANRNQKGRLLPCQGEKGPVSKSLPAYVSRSANKGYVPQGIGLVKGGK